MMLRQPSFWSNQAHPLAVALSPLSCLWMLAAKLRARMTTPYRSSAKVICIGNIAVGGSGKTPTALAVASRLQNKKICFLTRGYGGTQKKAVLIDHASDAALYGDEALLLSRAAPTIVAADRREGLKLAEQHGFEVVIADDGFQNPGFVKDVSILVIDGTTGLGNGRVMPAGPMRETIEAAAARATAVLIVGDDLTNVASLFPSLPILRGDFKVTPDAPVTDASYIAFAGIGHPDKFFMTLGDHGYALADVVSFPDHHPYTDADIDRLNRLAQRHNARLITTEKDFVRLPAGTDAAQLPVRLEITDDLDGVLK